MVGAGRGGDGQCGGGYDQGDRHQVFDGTEKSWQGEGMLMTA